MTGKKEKGEDAMKPTVREHQEMWTHTRNELLHTRMQLKNLGYLVNELINQGHGGSTAVALQTFQATIWECMDMLRSGLSRLDDTGV